MVPHAGVRLAAPAPPSRDLSSALTRYPEEGTVVPPQIVKASFRWDLTAPTPAVAPPPAPAPTVPSKRTDPLSRILAGPLTPAMIAGGLALAFALGATHALSPGHGKTLAAAYLAGSRGSWRDAVILGATVTVTHTCTVFMLGVGVLLFERYAAPERVVPFLTVVSGLAVAIVGVLLLIERVRALRDPGALTGRPHSHAGITHSHPTASLIGLGISGGLVPCPSALVLLLGSISLGRTGIGLGLLVAFSAGLAFVLTAIGLVVVYVRRLLPEREGGRRRILRYLPVASAAVVIALGAAMTFIALRNS